MSSSRGIEGTFLDRSSFLLFVVSSSRGFFSIKICNILRFHGLGRTGDSRGFAFVRYKYADEAQKAVEKLDGVISPINFDLLILCHRLSCLLRLLSFFLMRIREKCGRPRN